MTDSRSDPCSLDDPRVRGVLDRLHAEERAQCGQLARTALSWIPDLLRGREQTVQEESDRIKALYVSLSPKQVISPPGS